MSVEEEDDFELDPIEQEEPNDNVSLVKKRKKTSKPKPKRARLDPVHYKTSKEQCDLLWHFYHSEFKKNQLSQLEKDELLQTMFNESMFVDTEQFSQDHTNINYEAFIQFILPKWKKVLSSHASMPKGKPYLVIVCSSAIRCVEVIKCLPNISKLCKIGKMFSKHFKLEEQVELLQKYVYRVIVGTPARLQKLHEETGLFNEVKFVLLDMKKDSKERTLLTLPESQRDFFVLFEGIKNHKWVMY